MKRIRTRVLPVLLAAAVTGSVATPPSSALPSGGHIAPAHEHPLIRAAVARPKQAPPPPKLPVVNGPVISAARSKAAVNATTKVALRVLVIASSSTDFGLPTWKSTLERIGQPY